MKVESRHSALDLILLGMLFEEPMHAYRMRKLIMQRGVDRVVNVRHTASVYQTLERLRRLGLIETHETALAEGNKSRIIYAITHLGREIAMVQLSRLLATVGAGFTEFVAAVSVLTSLAPDDAKKQSEIRAAAVGKELSRLEAQSFETRELVQGILLDYRKTLLAAEYTWIQTFIADLSSGMHAWIGRRSGDIAVYPAPNLTLDLNKTAEPSGSA